MHIYIIYIYFTSNISICYIPLLFYSCTWYPFNWTFYHVYFFHFTDPEADKEATRLLTVNAENLMIAVGVVLNTTESALIKVPPEVRAHLTGLSWIKTLNWTGKFH